MQENEKVVVREMTKSELWVLLIEWTIALNSHK